MIKGIAASKGYAIGKVYLHEEVEIKINNEKPSRAKREIKRTNKQNKRTDSCFHGRRKSRGF